MCVYISLIIFNKKLYKNLFPIQFLRTRTLNVITFSIFFFSFQSLLLLYSHANSALHYEKGYTLDGSRILRIVVDSYRATGGKKIQSIPRQLNQLSWQKVKPLNWSIYVYIYIPPIPHAPAHTHTRARIHTRNLYPVWSRGSEIMPRNRFKQQTRTDSVTVPKRISR